MSSSVLLDTSFLVSLFDKDRTNHGVAQEYYRFMLAHGVAMYFSSIVAAEYGIKANIGDLPIRNFRPLNFSVAHAQVAAKLWNAIERESNDKREVVRDDVKLIAQASDEGIHFVLTEDAKTLYKYCERLRTNGHVQVRAVKLVDGFGPSALRADGQSDLLDVITNPAM